MAISAPPQTLPSLSNFYWRPSRAGAGGRERSDNQWPRRQWMVHVSGCHVGAERQRGDGQADRGHTEAEAEAGVRLPGRSPGASVALPPSTLAAGPSGVAARGFTHTPVPRTAVRSC